MSLSMFKQMFPAGVAALICCVPPAMAGRPEQPAGSARAGLPPAATAAMVSSPLRRPVKGYVPGTLPGPKQEPIRWQALYRHSSLFLGIMHGFRFATEAGTRHGLKGPFFHDYGAALGSMHGWSDGDPFLVNYVGHPMQGAVSGFLLVQHDPKYRTFQLGRDRRYWKSRLRGMAYAWAFSEQFETGLLSEASLGNIQSRYPAYGFVDHVITPAIGMGWMVMEDALDRYVIRKIERRTGATWLRILARTSLNPARGMANLVSFRNPWRRDDRPTIFWDYELEDRLLATRAGPAMMPADPPKVREIPVAEFTAQPHVLWYNAGRANSTLCIGGGGFGQWNVSRNWSLVADVGGCRLLGLGEYHSGDSLTYLFGTQWNSRRSRRLTPYFRVLAGGDKVTEEELLPEKITQLEKEGKQWTRNENHAEVARMYEKNAVAFLVGGGIDVVIHPALSLQIANLDYLYTGLGEFCGRSYTHSVRLTAGLTLRVSTW